MVMTVKVLEDAIQRGSLCQLCRFNCVNRRCAPCARCMQGAREHYTREFFTLPKEVHDG